MINQNFKNKIVSLTDTQVFITKTDWRKNPHSVLLPLIQILTRVYLEIRVLVSIGFWLNPRVSSVSTQYYRHTLYIYSSQCVDICNYINTSVNIPEKTQCRGMLSGAVRFSLTLTLTASTNTVARCAGGSQSLLSGQIDAHTLGEYKIYIY